MYKNPKNIMQQHLKEQLSNDKESSHIIEELIKISLLKNASKDEDLVIFAEIYKALGVESFTTLINLIDGRTLDFPSKDDFRELLITVLCYYYKEVENKDWEDIAADDDHYYIADTGNNYANRKNLKIYIITKELIVKGEISVSYSAQKDFTKRALNSFDAEALTVVGDSLVLFSKNRLTQKSELYTFPKKAGDYVLSPSAILKVESLITAADYNQTLDLLALTGYNFKGDQFFYIVSNFIKNGWNAIALKKYLIPIEKAQIEAVKIQDISNFLLTSEGEKNGFARLIDLKVTQ